MAIPEFARRLALAAALPFAMVDADTGVVVAQRVEPALTRAARRRGLLGQESIDRRHALALAPCAAVHTVGMRFAIDVLFVSRRGRVLKVVTDLRPWRIAGRLGAYAAVELQAGALDACGVRVGDQLLLAPQV